MRNDTKYWYCLLGIIIVGCSTSARDIDRAAVSRTPLQLSTLEEASLIRAVEEAAVLATGESVAMSDALSSQALAPRYRIVRFRIFTAYRTPAVIARNPVGDGGTASFVDVVVDEGVASSLTRGDRYILVLSQVTDQLYARHRLTMAGPMQKADARSEKAIQDAMKIAEWLGHR